MTQFTPRQETKSFVFFCFFVFLFFFPDTTIHWHLSCDTVCAMYPMQIRGILNAQIIIVLLSNQPQQFLLYQMKDAGTGVHEHDEQPEPAHRQGARGRHCCLQVSHSDPLTVYLVLLRFRVLLKKTTQNNSTIVYMLYGPTLVESASSGALKQVLEKQPFIQRWGLSSKYVTQRWGQDSIMMALPHLWM